MLSDPGPWAWTGWRPIATAPRNGVLIVAARYDDAQPVRWWTVEQYVRSAKREGSYDPGYEYVAGWGREDGMGLPEDPDYFTHWMPFPAPE